jgi:hypothetical protein
MREERDAIDELERTTPGYGSLLGTPNLDKLLKLGAPDVITDELLEQATLPEIFALLNAILKVNAPLEGRP